MTSTALAYADEDYEDSAVRDQLLTGNPGGYSDLGGFASDPLTAWAPPEPEWAPPNSIADQRRALLEAQQALVQAHQAVATAMLGAVTAGGLAMTFEPPRETFWQAHVLRGFALPCSTGDEEVPNSTHVLDAWSHASVEANADCDAPAEVECMCESLEFTSPVESRPGARVIANRSALPESEWEF